MSLKCMLLLLRHGSTINNNHHDGYLRTVEAMSWLAVVYYLSEDLCNY